MKKIYCELHMFDLHQRVYIVDPTTGDKECVAIATMEDLPGVISSVSDEKDVKKVLLSGNSVLGSAVAEDIVSYCKLKYSKNDIEVEVLK